MKNVKKLKRLVALALSVVMVLAMSVFAFAEDKNVNLTKHTFNAYQIFAGTWSGETLTDITWGNGVKDKALLSELDSTVFGKCKSAADVAKILDGKSGEDSVVVNFAKKVARNVIPDNVIKGTSAAGIVNLSAAGYYLIEDVTDVTGKDDAKNLSILKVSNAGSVSPTVKTDKPKLEKKVQDTNDSTGQTTGWQDSADYDIGDSIPYQLTAILGDISNYDKYYLKFTDTMTHLTLNLNSVKVTVNGKVLKYNATDSSKSEYTLQWNKSTKEMAVEIEDVIALGAESGQEVVVTYNATLDADATIGYEGNPNVADLTYSNNPNNAGKGETGKTPEDKNIVFTYDVIANKTDKDGEKLTGAVFELFKKNAKTGEYESLGIKGGTKDGDNITVDENTTKFEWKGLDDGEYKLVEVVAPEGYNKIAAQQFTITADHDITSDNPKLKSLIGSGATIPFTANKKPDKDGNDQLNGELATNVVNEKGSTLPSTGGIGTTIFYVVGAILMVGAAVLLITKRRAEN